MAPSVVYLGYIIDKDGLHPTPEKIKAIQEALAPSSVSQLRAFIWMLNYYAKFLPNMATQLAPLYALLGKDKPWLWGKVEQEAFENAKSYYMLLVANFGMWRFTLRSGGSAIT